VAAGAGIDRLTRMLVARWLCAAEDNLVRLAANVGWHADPQAAVDYLDELVEAGYHLADAETALRDQLVNASTDDDRDEDEDDDQGNDDTAHDDRHEGNERTAAIDSKEGDLVAGDGDQGSAEQAAEDPHLVAVYHPNQTLRGRAGTRAPADPARPAARCPRWLSQSERDTE
jgi:ParB family chromosome partitioning protein